MNMKSGFVGTSLHKHAVMLLMQEIPRHATCDKVTLYEQ